MPPPDRSQQRGNDIDAMVDELERRGEAWADADAAMKALDESRKPVLAQAILVSEGKSMAERETKALASEAYRRHLQALEGAVRTANMARVRYDAWKIKIELFRTAAATQRAAMGMR